MNQVILRAFQDELLKIAAEAKEKDALFGLGAAKAVPKAVKPLAMSFKGHGAALSKVTGTKVDPRGIVNTRSWNPMSQSRGGEQYLTGVEGWTPQYKAASVKLASTAALRMIRKLVAQGTPEAMAQANRLAKTPGFMKATAAGSQIKRLGKGIEGTATLTAHPQFGVSVRKAYNPASPIASPEMITRKVQMAKQLPSSDVAQTLGVGRSGSGTRMTFHEYMPGAEATNEQALTLARKMEGSGAQAGYHMHDVRPSNIRGGKAVDYLPFKPGEAKATSPSAEGSAVGLLPKGQKIFRRQEQRFLRAGGQIPENSLYRTLPGGSAKPLSQIPTAPARAPVQPRAINRPMPKPAIAPALHSPPTKVEGLGRKPAVQAPSSSELDWSGV